MLVEGKAAALAPRSPSLLSLFLKPTQCPFLAQFPFLALPAAHPSQGRADSLPPTHCKPKLCPPSAPQPEWTAPPSGLTWSWAVAAHVTDTRGGSGGGHRQTFTGDPNSRFEPLSPEVTVKKMPKLKC